MKASDAIKATAIAQAISEAVDEITPKAQAKVYQTNTRILKGASKAKEFLVEANDKATIRNIGKGVAKAFGSVKKLKTPGAYVVDRIVVAFDAFCTWWSSLDDMTRFILFFFIGLGFGMTMPLVEAIAACIGVALVDMCLLWRGWIVVSRQAYTDTRDAFRQLRTLVTA